MIGLSDGGYCTYLLGTWVREKQLMPIERAVQRIVAEPARFFGVPNRGVLAPGMAADIAIFDAATIGSPRRPEMRHDLPGQVLRAGAAQAPSPQPSPTRGEGAKGREVWGINGLAMEKNGR